MPLITLHLLSHDYALAPHLQVCHELITNLPPAAVIKMVHMLHLSSIDVYGPAPERVWQRAMVSNTILLVTL